MRASLSDLLDAHAALVADGATGTNYMQMGLGPGEPPELWNVEHPERVTELYQLFVEAGADIILTNTFGGNASRLALHHAEGRVHELNAAAARLARAVADEAERPVVVAGSVGPTGALFEPLGPMTHDQAVALFTDQIEGLRDGGADVAWIETMSAPEEMRAAAEAACAVGLPYTVTGSFDTAGRTMMGVHPGDLAGTFAGVAEAPLATGANCGVGAADMLVTVLHMDAEAGAVIAKGNCGIPQFQGTEIVYSGTPELMERYARLAVHAGARIVGGCCGTSPEHLAAIRRGVDAGMADLAAGSRQVPDHDTVVAEIGPLTQAVPSTAAGQRAGAGERRLRRRG